MAKIDLNDVPWVKTAAIILILFFGWRLIEIGVLANLQMRADRNTAQQGLQSCQTRLNQSIQRANLLANQLKKSQESGN